MAHSFRIDAPSVPVRPTAAVRRLVQARADDVVLAAARFRPNAAGFHELSLGAGFGHRQCLKAEGAYHGERVVLGVTALHVHALAVGFGGRATRRIGCWRRADVRAELVAPRGRALDDLWPALLLTDCSCRHLIELQVIDHDDEAWHLLTLLLRSASPR